MKDDFKFNESNTESGTNTNQVNKKLTLIIIIAVAVFFGLTVFIILSLIFNRNNQNNNKPVEIPITNKEVKTLYNMVTYTELGLRNNKFMIDNTVTQESMSNKDKYECALSLVKKSDFKPTGQAYNGVKEYYLDESTLKNYMTTFFGKGVNYSTNSSIEYTFNFLIDNNNTGTLKYSQSEKKYKIFFTSTKEEIPDTLENQRYFQELYKAEKSNDELILYEKIVYPKCTKNSTNTYNCVIYRDYDRSIEIDEIKGIEEDKTFNFNELKETNEIIYTFKKDIEDNYYFYSSKTNEQNN